MERTQKGIRTVRIPGEGYELIGDLFLPAEAAGLVLFAHGSGSSRHSPRNRFVAGKLVEAHLASLLTDLLTAKEDATDQISAVFRFDIDLLASRLVRITDWLKSNPDTSALPLGYFGASTGSAAALKAAVQRPDSVRAIVSRGGRPDLAEDALAEVETPALFIVGGNDRHVLYLNQIAMKRMKCIRRMEIVPGATHLFEEPGTLERVADLAVDWFARNLTAHGMNLSAQGLVP